MTDLVTRDGGTGTTLPTPRLDRATIFRLTLEDFPLDQEDLDRLTNPDDRYQLEETLRSILNLDTITSQAVQLWRERRDR